MFFEEAIRLHKIHYYEGKNKFKKEIEYVFPYNFLHETDLFIEVEVSLDILETQDTDSERVDKYIEIMKKKDMESIWISYGKKLKDGSVIRYWHSRFYVVDGNHRTAAARFLKRGKIKAIVPESHYDCFVRFVNDKNS